jgi:hypothetical protein
MPIKPIFLLKIDLFTFISNYISKKKKPSQTDLTKDLTMILGFIFLGYKYSVTDHFNNYEFTIRKISFSC